MKKQFIIFKLIVFVLPLLATMFLNGQTNPSAQSLPFSQDYSSLAHSSTAYPAGIQGWTMSAAPGSSFNTNAPTADRTLTANSTASTNSGNVHNYNGKIGFLNNSSLDLTIVVAVNTTGKENIDVQYDVMTIRNPYDGGSNTRINEVTLQYRVGTSGSFTTLSGVEYQNNTTTQTGTVTTPQNLLSKSITLPADCNNQPVVQVRWASRQISGAGSRPSFAFDNILIDGDVISTPTPTLTLNPVVLAGFEYYFSLGPSSAQPFNVSGTDLTGNVSVTAPTSYEISETINGAYGGSVSLIPSSGSVNQDLYVRLKTNLAVGAYNNEQVLVQSAGALDKTVTCSGNVLPLVPTVYTNPASLTGFTYVIGNGPSTEKIFTIEADNLTGDLVLTPPADYEISLQTGVNFIAQNPITLSPSGGSVPLNNIYVRLKAGLAINTYTENITVSTTGISDILYSCSGNVTNPLPAAIVLLRPSYIDISTTTSESAVLMKLENYPSDDARYKLYNSTNQYNCWDEATDEYVTLVSYADNPQVPGTPTTSTTFWILSQRGTNIATGASYRDRLAPYTSNYQTTVLPAATEIVNSFTLTGTFAGTPQYDNAEKRVVLAYSGSTLISAASTTLNTGTFAVVCPDGTTIDKIEFRAVDNTLIDQITGSWNDDAEVTNFPVIMVSLVSLSGFSYFEGSGPSQEQTFSVSGIHLTANISVTPPVNYEISKSTGTGFVSYPNTLIFIQNGGTVADSTVYVRLKAGLAQGDYNNEVIEATSSGAATKSITCNGSVLQALPTITVNPQTLSGFTYVIGNGPSAEQSFEVSGVNLTSPISISPAINYEISTGTGGSFTPEDPLLIYPSGGYVPVTLINVRLKAGLTIADYNNDTITVTSAGAINKTVICSGNVTNPLPAAIVISRPAYIDLSSSTSQSAVLMKIENYPADSARYRLYSGSNQYDCWNEETDAYVTSTAYVNGPMVPGTPSTSTTFWIMFNRGTNNLTTASYRDRLAPLYDANYQTTVLPAATAITNSFTLTGTFISSGIYDNTVKHVVLAYSNSILISAASTTLNTGIFAVVCPDGIVIDKVEIRTFDNILIEQINGSWNDDADITTTPTIATSVSSLNGFSYYEGFGPSATQSFTVAGFYLTNDIIITPPADYEISLSSGTGFVGFPGSISLTHSGGNVLPTPVYVRLKAGLAIGDYNAELISLTSAGAINKTVSCSGSVLPAVPTITLNTATLTGFLYFINNGPSTEKMFTVRGDNLTADITLTPPLDYEISTGTGGSFSAQNPLVLTQSSGSVPETTIHVRLKAGLPVGTYNDEIITITSSGAADKSVTCSGSVTDPVPTATVIARPSHVDISSATSEGAVLMHLENYTTDDARYRLYNGSFQYNCWNEDSTAYITSFSYSDAPFAPGTPTTSSIFWILYQRGGNINTAANYRDRIGPLYSATHLTTPLPAATAITSPFNLTGVFTGSGIYDNTVKHVVLAYSGTSLVSAASTTLTTGTFTLLCPDGTTIDKIEVRAVDNTLIDYITGSWTVTTDVGEIPYVPVTKTLIVSVFPEGLYNEQLDALVPSQDYVSGGFVNKYDQGIADHITVELHYQTSPYDIVETYSDVELLLNGTATITTIPATLTGDYYIVVKHRNSIETWSSSPVSFNVPGPVTFDFTLAASSAYGNNLKQKGLKYVIFTGDINGDNFVEASDVALIDNSVTLLVKGYVPEDLNGDGQVDASDIALLDNNVTALVKTFKP